MGKEKKISVKLLTNSYNLALHTSHEQQQKMYIYTKMDGTQCSLCYFEKRHNNYEW